MVEGRLAMIALGSNVGDRHAHLAAARGALSLLPGATLRAASRVEETAPFGSVAQGPYLNQMIALHTAMPARVLLAALHQIERALGRVRGTRWGPRTIDLDIVQLGREQSDARDLMLPHPGLGNRDFWQRELRELELLLGAA